MNENIHNDNLEQLLQKYLQDNKIEPTNDDKIWDNIAAGLDASKPTTEASIQNYSTGDIKLKPKRSFTLWSAAAALLLIVVVGQMIFHQREMASLKKEIANQFNESKAVQKNKQNESAHLHSNENASNENEPIILQNIDKESSIDAISNRNHVTAEISINPESKNNLFSIEKKSQGNANERLGQNLSDSSNNNFVNNELQNVISNDNPPSNNTQLQQVINNESLPIGKDQEQEIVTNDIKATTEIANIGSSELSLPTLPNVSQNLLMLNPTLDLSGLKKQGIQNTIPIKPINNHKGDYSIGLMSSLFRTNKNIANFDKIDDDHDNTMRKRFSGQKRSFGVTKNMALTITKSIAPKWSVYGGVGLQQSLINDNHSSRFRFSDRNDDGNGGPEEESEYAFDYELNSTIGTIDVRVNVEEIDTSIVHNDGENISLNINSTIRSKQLIFPVGVDYRFFTKNKFNLFARVGLLPKLSLEQNYQVNDITINNENLKPKNADDKFIANIKDVNSLSLDYQLGLGLNYQVNKKLGITLMPTYVSSVSNELNKSIVAVRNNNLGIGIGVQYLF